MHNNHLLQPDRRRRTFPLAAAIRFQARRCIDYILRLGVSAELLNGARNVDYPVETVMKIKDLESFERISMIPNFRQFIEISGSQGASFLHLTAQFKRPAMTIILV